MEIRKEEHQRMMEIGKQKMEKSSNKIKERQINLEKIKKRIEEKVYDNKRETFGERKEYIQNECYFSDFSLFCFLINQSCNSKRCFSHSTESLANR